MNQNLPPLAERMRPSELSGYVGQEHLLGADKPLGRLIKSGRLPSLILWGPPGSGKTTLARLLAKAAGLKMHALSAVGSGVKDVRAVIDESRKTGLFVNKPVLFIDEIHRFSKSQQDSLLQAVEEGFVTLIGATTENPSFEVIRPLLSRVQVYVLQALSAGHLKQVAVQALKEDQILSKLDVRIEEWDRLLAYSGGDARRLLNALEILVSEPGESAVVIDNAFTEAKMAANLRHFDKGGDMHYDIASALIKSIRGSDPNGAVYWLARLIDGGEDVRFIARRLVIAAAEDVGNANPNALVLAEACFSAVDKIGYPEARIPLAQCAVYLATSPKSNAAYLAVDAALEEIKKTGHLPVPLHLRNAPTGLMKDLNYGQGYLYPHDHPGNFVPQQYLPDALVESVFYRPGSSAREREEQKYLAGLFADKYDSPLDK